MVSTNKTLKINYVLCREFNTSYSCIKDIIRYAMDHPSVKLRFLETAVNDTNNHDGRMSKYIFTQKEFEDILIEIGYQKSIENKRSDSRSSCLYDINGCVVKFIKFFCNNNCDECPEDKTSLWLTSTGEIKKCSYRRTATRIENWNYERIARQLEIFIDPICE